MSPLSLYTNTRSKNWILTYVPAMMVATIIDWLLRSYSLRSSCEGLLTLYININYICSAGFYMHEYQTWWILLTQRMPLPTGPCCFVDLTMHHFKDDSQPWHQTPGNAKSTMDNKSWRSLNYWSWFRKIYILKSLRIKLKLFYI